MNTNRDTTRWASRPLVEWQTICLDDQGVWRYADGRKVPGQDRSIPRLAKAPRRKRRRGRDG